MANYLSRLSSFLTDVNDFSFRLEGNIVETNTGDDENDLSFRLDGETAVVTNAGEVVGAVAICDVNGLSLWLGGEIVEDST